MAWSKGATPKGGELDYAEKKKKALDMRQLGLPYSKISAELGYKEESGARKLVESALKELPMESAEEYRTLELERLDRMTSTMFPKALRGDTKAAETVLGIMRHRMKLTGIDQVQVDDGQSDAMDKLAQLIQAVQAAAQGEGLHDSD